MWTLTVMEDSNDRMDVRCVGAFASMTDAEEVVLSNHFDIHEGNYDLAVIEHIGFGLYPEVLEDKWYRWVGGGYIECEKPEKFSYATNFGIG